MRAGERSTSCAGRSAERLLATGQALWRYRVALHDAALEAIEPG